MNGSNSNLSFKLTSFSAGKSADRNEDAFGYNATTIVLSDGVTDKVGTLYEKDEQKNTYKTGGEVASCLVVQTALKSNLNGQELVEEITECMKQYYANNAPQALKDSMYRFAATMAVASIVDTQLVVTQVGDTSFRINGQDEYKNDKEIDTINANLRKTYIEETGDVPGGREHILPRLKEQYKLQNNSEDRLGYGVLDGSLIPAKFIRTFSFSMSEVKTLELVTDGYFGAFPPELNIESYEKLHRHIESVDPYKIGPFASTKTSDDRTVLIVEFGR